MSASDFPLTVRVAVRNRCMGRCEWCGHNVGAPDLHHRVFRSRGGGPGGDNAIALCRNCHRRAHGAAEGDLDAAYRAGVSLRSGQDPADIPIRSVVFGMPMWLLADGDTTFDRPAGPTLTGT